MISCLTVDNRACVHARPTCNVDDKSTRVVNFFTVTAVLEPVRTVRWPVSRRTPCTAVSAEAVTAVAMVVSIIMVYRHFEIWYRSARPHTGERIVPLQCTTNTALQLSSRPNKKLSYRRGTARRVVSVDTVLHVAKMFVSFAFEKPCNGQMVVKG